jgi:hypothetical protein
MAEMTPEMYLPAEQAEGLGTQDEQQQSHFDSVARGLSQRHYNEYVTGAITDQDIDEGGVHPVIAENEAALQNAIAQASRATNPAERAKWQAEAEKLATRSVVAQEQTVNKREVTDEDRMTTFERLSSQGHDVRGVLDFAADFLDDKSIDEFNAVLNGKNKREASDAFGVLDQARRHPERFTTVDEIVPFNQIEIQEFADRFGADTARQIELTTLNLQQGSITPLEAIQNIRRQPEIARNIDVLMQEGRLTLPL